MKLPAVTIPMILTPVPASAKPIGPKCILTIFNLSPILVNPKNRSMEIALRQISVYVEICLFISFAALLLLTPRPTKNDFGKNIQFFA